MWRVSLEYSIQYRRIGGSATGNIIVVLPAISTQYSSCVPGISHNLFTRPGIAVHSINDHYCTVALPGTWIYTVLDCAVCTYGAIRYSGLDLIRMRI